MMMAKKTVMTNKAEEMSTKMKKNTLNTRTPKSMPTDWTITELMINTSQEQAEERRSRRVDMAGNTLGMARKTTTMMMLTTILTRL